MVRNYGMHFVINLNDINHLLLGGTMKRFISMLLVISSVMIFSACQEENLTEPQESQDNQTIASLESQSLAKTKVTTFSGKETFVQYLEPGTITPLPNGSTLLRGIVAKYHDEASDPRVTGDVIWVVNGIIDDKGNATYWGTGELSPLGGKWDLKYVAKGSPDGSILYEVVGHGKEGAVKGLAAQWTHIMKAGDDFTTFKGFIIDHKLPMAISALTP